MQRGLWLGLGLAVLGGVVWLVIVSWPEAPAPGEQARQGTNARLAPGLQSLLQAPRPDSAPKPTGLTIQGTVLGSTGLVAGARVLATLAVEGETLSTLPCEAIRTYQLLECAWDGMGLRVAELVEERRGEALTLAEAVTAEDGSFVLSGLEPGSYALWVESVEGAGFQDGVDAGSSSVVLRMGAGVRLSGTVTDDTKAPVPGALVTAIFSAHSRFFETVTDAHGRYELGPLPGGLMVLVIRREGMLPAVQPRSMLNAVVKMDFELSRPRRLTGRVLRSKVPVPAVAVHAMGIFDTELGTAITDAQGRYTFEALPAFDVSLTAQHGDSAAGVRLDKKDSWAQDIDLELKPAAMLQGVVRDEHGEPVLEAKLMLSLWDDTPEDGFMGPTWDISAEGGAYRIGPLPPGRYGFKISHPRFLPIEEEDTLVLGAGETQRDFHFRRAFLAEGVLVDSEGNPVAGETLDLTPAETAEPGLESEATTEDDGRFVFAVSRPGEYLLRARSPRLKALEVPVRVPVAGLRIVAGVLFSVKGEVVDDAGGPLGDVTVSLWDEKDHAKSSRRGFARTDVKGRFSLEVPAPGRYEVTAVMAWRDTLRVASRAITVEGQPTQRVQLRLSTGQGLSGVVVDWHGRPVPEVLLQLLPSPRYTERVQCCHPDYHLSTDAEGRFALTEAAGEYVELCIKKGDYAVVGSTSAQPRCTRLKNEGQPVRVILGREGFVTGRLVRADGSPVNHFFVNGQEKRREDGEFSIRVLQPGVEPINLSAPGGYSVQRTAPVFPDGEVIVDLGSILLSP